MPESLIQKFSDTPDKLPRQMRDFLSWLAKNAPSNIDLIVQSLHDEVFEGISCLECANCCKTVGPALKDVDIERLARHLRVKPSKLVDDYLEIDQDGDYIFRNHPCPFLMSDNHCTVYESRPRACREYPHTDRRRTMQLANIHRKNIECCPAVFEIFNRLKTRLEKK